MRKPNFLLIGAMKSGTTTVYEDLRHHPEIGFSHVKEPARLQDPHVLSAQGSASYFQLFSDVQHKSIIGDASPQYSFAPGFPDTALHAKQLLGPDLRLAYLMRDPIRRAISHHYHIYSRGGCGSDFVEENRRMGIFENYGRYGMQLERWLEQYPLEQLICFKFEDYMDNREHHARQLVSFVGLDAAQLPAAEGVHNVGEASREPGFMSWISARFPSARARIADLASQDPTGTWSRLRGLLYQPPKERPPAPPRSELERLAEVFEKDHAVLKRCLGDATPSWDLKKTVMKLSESRSAHTSL